jgi:hypothetical protein
MATSLSGLGAGMSRRKMKRAVREVFGGTVGASMQRKALRQLDSLSLPGELAHVARKLEFDEFLSVPLEEVDEDAPLTGIPFLMEDSELLGDIKTQQRACILNPFQSLDSMINKALDKASASGDRGANTTGVRAWRAFCKDVMGVAFERPLDPLTTPLVAKLAEEWLVMRFVCSLVQVRGAQPRTAAQYFSSVQGWHLREFGIKLAAGLKLERLPQMVKGLRRIYGDAPKKIRRGISPKKLREAMDIMLDPSVPAHANIRAALSTAVQGLLRSQEFCVRRGSHRGDTEVPRRCHLTSIDARRMVMLISPCKNVNHQGGLTCPLVVGAGGEYIDAVREMANLRAVDKSAYGDGDTPLFRDPTTNRPLTYETVLEWTQVLMAAVGEDPALFGTHSYRIGGATAIFAAGGNETVIRTMGRWSSDIHRLYVHTCFEKCCDWTKAAGSTDFADTSGAFDEVDDY